MSRAAQLVAAPDARPFAGPPLPRLRQRDALRRAAGADRPRAGELQNVMPTLEFILRSEATKDLAPKRPGRTIRANGASCGELAAVDDARAAREGRGGGRFSP